MNSILAYKMESILPVFFQEQVGAQKRYSYRINEFCKVHSWCLPPGAECLGIADMGYLDISLVENYKAKR